MSKPEWERLMTEDGTILYEGLTIFGKPYGSGTVYFSYGHIYQEGVFGIKGLQCGREYYPNGNLRFEGLYELCKGYGPNYPKFGKCYDPDGALYYTGELKHHFGGVGYPMVDIPKEYGPIPQAEKPDIHYFMWEDTQGNDSIED